MAKAKRKRADPTEDAMLQAVADFLKTKGWNVVVIGGARVQKQPGDLEFNYEFVVRFTGGQRQTPTGVVTEQATPPASAGKDGR